MLICIYTEGYSLKYYTNWIQNIGSVKILQYSNNSNWREATLGDASRAMLKLEKLLKSSVDLLAAQRKRIGWV